MVTAIAVDPIPQGLFVHPDFPGGRRNRLGFLDHHPSDLFLVFRSERPALVRHGHPLFRERTLVDSLSGRSLAPHGKSAAADRPAWRRGLVAAGWAGGRSGP